MKKKYITNSRRETVELGEALGKKLKPGDIVALRGDLGMGKTAFVTGMASALGCDKDKVSSPTYTILNIYEGKTRLYHFDMYRVNGMDDLYSTGFFDYLDSSGVMAVEWSENIDFALTDDCIYVTISGGDNENQRIITIG